MSYGGSEMVTLELAEYFAAAGSRVTIGTWTVGPPMMPHLRKHENISYFDLEGEELSERLAADPPQLAWIHHQLVPKYLLQYPAKTTFVFNHMSAVHPLELSWSAGIEATLASLHLYNSPETLEGHRSRALAGGFRNENMQVFPNPAPDDFGDVKVRIPGRPLRLGIVSNHPPDELAELCDGQPPELELEIIGNSPRTGSNAVRITPQKLERLDGVITIGKTVQYAILAGLPVYCYDKFGGPGWLSSENFTSCERRNFSGRGFAQKTSTQIALELFNGFASAAAYAADLRRSDVSRFTLSRALEKVVLAVHRGGGSSRPLGEQIEAHALQQKVVGHYARNWLRLQREATES